MSADYSPTQSIEFAVKNITRTTNYKKFSGTEVVQKAASVVIKVGKRGAIASTTTTTRPATVKAVTTTIKIKTKAGRAPDLRSDVDQHDDTCMGG
jgi:transaldolase